MFASTDWSAACVCVQGYVRFDEDQGAKKAMEGMTADGAKPEICGKETELRVLEGESGSQ